MKKLFLYSTLSVVAVFAITFFTIPSLNKFVSFQMAQVIGINLNAVTGWQLQGGLKKDLSVGDTGRDVRLLQYALNKSLPNFSGSNITGNFGPQTLQGVSDFQKKNQLTVTGVLDSNTREVMNRLYFTELCPEGQGEIPNQIIFHVNKENALPEDYIPSNLVDISYGIKTMGIVCVKGSIATPLREMFKQAKKENIDLAVTSGFRRKEIQKSIYDAWIKVGGEKEKNRVAKPLHSEHQLGTVLDFTGGSIKNISASDSFHNTKEEVWLRQNAYKYGFALSYPEGKTDITGYDYEPWHYRFLGTDVALEIFNKGISVEEYFDSLAE
jgi:LAS superfamily LD-carboxypeptidase LdcB